MRQAVLGTAILGALAAFPAASAPSLSLPVDCVLGDTCFIQNYVDQDPSTGHTDHTCGPLTYDTHKGTDFALPTLRAMHAGVDVRAAADGIVTGVRDGMADRVATLADITTLEGKDCGNGVVLDHGDGWVTQYCHMKQGSVSVQKGQRVAQGATLGAVGLSGRTQFPHLHISVRKDDAVVDPFAPSTQNSCGETQPSLWNDDIAYVPGGLIRSGFDVAIPKFETIKSGDAGRAKIPAHAKALVLFAHGYGAQPGDQLTLHIENAAGQDVITQTVTLDKTQAQYFRAVGRRTPQNGWPYGAYRGEVTLKRDGTILGQNSVVLHIE